jgi:glycerol-3-phosphate acyltransferase PlsY
MPLVIFTGYLIGSVPFALLLARRIGGADPRQVGSGNLGAANVLRTSGVRAAILVAALDIAKGAAGVLLAIRLSPQAAAPAAAGLAAIIGHVYPVWLRFRGGKGVATACGVFLVLAPIAVLPAVMVFVLTVWATRYVSLGSVLASLVLPAIAYATGSPAPVVIVASAAAALILLRHHANLRRLVAGTERRLGGREASAALASPAARVRRPAALSQAPVEESRNREDAGAREHGEE